MNFINEKYFNFFSLIYFTKIIIKKKQFILFRDKIFLKYFLYENVLPIYKQKVR